jgi:hypothetical protein
LAEVITDASGEAALDHVGTAVLNVQVTAEGYQSDEVAGIHLDAEAPYRWTLKKAQPLMGVVMSAETQRPIPGARIKLAGLRGPHNVSYSDPGTAPVLATADEQGRFALTTLSSLNRYFLFIEAPEHGGVLLGEIKAGQADLKIALGPELVVRGKVIHIPAGLMHRGEVSVGYSQYFKIGDGMMAAGRQVMMKPVNDEAEFSIGPLYAYPLVIQLGEKEVKLDAKELPKSELVIDLGK